MTDRLITAREVADRLGVHPETVLRWTRQGKLPAIRLSRGAIRYREDKLDEWLASRATGADTPPDSEAGARSDHIATDALTTGDVTSHG